MYASVCNFAFVALRLLLQFEKSITIVRPQFSRRDQNFQLVLACWFMFYLEFIKVLRNCWTSSSVFWILSRTKKNKIKNSVAITQGEIILRPRKPPFSVCRPFSRKIITQIKDIFFLRKEKKSFQCGEKWRIFFYKTKPEHIESTQSPFFLQIFVVFILRKKKWKTTSTSKDDEKNKKKKNRNFSLKIVTRRPESVWNSLLAVAKKKCAVNRPRIWFSSK